MHIVNRPADTTQLRKNVNRTYVIYSYIDVPPDLSSTLV